MSHLKITKKGNKYVYNFGFGFRYYTCACGSHKVLVKPKGGFQPPDLICEDCGQIVTNTPNDLEELEEFEQKYGTLELN